MNRYILILASAALFVLASCSSGYSVKRAKVAKVAKLQAIHRVDTLDHLCYFGSDKDWHYIGHSQKYGGGSYKVSRSELSIAKEIPLINDSINKCSLMSGKFVLAPNGRYNYSQYENAH
jgi:hypothetical protein